MDNEAKVEYTDTQLQFLDLIKKYPVKNPETVVDYVTSQGETVLEEPSELAQALSECEITPVRRRQILKHWFASQGVDVPEPILKQATMSTENKAIVAERETKKEEKYSVDTETGAIKVASTTDKTALTWDEAEKLSAKIKKDIETREKKEAKAEAKAEAKEKVGEGDEEIPFILDGEGNWILNPKAKIGGMELLAFEAVRKSQERGEPLDPFEVMKERARDIEMMRSVFGAGEGGRGPIDSVEDLIKLKSLLGADEDTKALLSGIYKRLSEGGEGKGESEDIKALRDELKDLNKKLEQKERERLADQITGLQNEMSNVRGELTKARTEASAKNEYGIMSEGLKVADRRLGAIENIIQGIFGRRPPLLETGEKRELTEAISKEAKDEAELDQLAEKVFYPPS